MPNLVLFDIDNTLLWSGGAGGRAMNLTFRDMFGIDDGFARVEFSGRTDRSIFAEGMRQHRIRGDGEALLREFMERYFSHLPATLSEMPGKLMPGFPQLLQTLQQRPDVWLGLATGNFRRSGYLKLAHYGLDGFFPDGGFGEESEERADIVRLAAERLARGLDMTDVVVVGDTPHDVDSALACGAVAAGVATGRHSVDELRACGAQLVFPDFADWERTADALLAG